MNDLNTDARSKPKKTRDQKESEQKPFDVLFRKNYRVHERVLLSFVEKTKTKQSFKDECDINTIMKKYQSTGQLPFLIQSQPQYGDFSDVASFQEAMHIVQHANEQFENLSAEIRNRFRNDPALFLQFCEDPQNGEELVRLGLATKREGANPPPAPSKTPQSTEPVPSNG